MEVTYLARRPELTDQVVRMLTAAFGGPAAEPFFRELLAHTMETEGIPATIIAVEGDTAVGTVGVWRSDMLCRQDLTPWIGCLTVDAAWRGRHIGSELQAFARDHCRRCGQTHLYLYTQLVGYYEKTGWEYMGQFHNLDGSEHRVFGCTR